MLWDERGLERKEVKTLVRTVKVHLIREELTKEMLHLKNAKMFGEANL